MKKIALLGLALVGLMATPAVAAEWGAPKVSNLEVGGDLGFGWLGASAGYEMGLLEFKIAPQFNLNFSVKVAAGANLWWLTGLQVGAAGYAVLHYPLKQLNLGIDFVNRIDYYAGLGLGVGILGAPYPIYPAYTSGASYDLNGNMAVFAGYNEFGGGIFGIKLAL